MKLRRFAILVVSTTLSGCGGGGAGGGVNPPPPPPPSSQSNSSLLNLQYSESFTNDAATASGRFLATGDIYSGNTAALSTLTVNYDATSRSYTVSTSGRSTEFAPANKDSVQSGNGITIYTKNVGQWQESLSLTDPGTSGPLTYQYVGSGFWQRAKTGSSSADFTFDAFTYGAETLNSGVPRTGGGAFAVTLIGAMAWGAPVALAGSGNLITDFATGAISTSGQFSLAAMDGSPLGSGTFGGQATLSSSANNFSGNFNLVHLETLDGTIRGRFYGPQAQEVGAAWAVKGPDGRVATGTLMGRQDSSISSDTTLTNMRSDNNFRAFGAALFYTTSISTGEYVGGDGDVVGLMHFADNADGTFIISEQGRSDVTVAASSKNTGQSNARFTVYDQASGDVAQRLRLYNPGSGNTELPLTYASFGNWQVTTTEPAFNDRVTRSLWFAYGFQTDPLLMPKSGTAKYDGIIYGDAELAGGTGPAYTLKGTSHFDINFQSGSYSGSISAVGTDIKSGAQNNFGTFNIAPGSMTGSAFSGFFVDSNNSYLGNFDGSLYGPNASELAGAFMLKSQVPLNNEPLYYLRGVAAAVKTGP